MKIANISATIHSFPVFVPLIDDPVEYQKIVFCKVETDEGVTGYGMTGHVLPGAVVAAIEKSIAPVIKGFDPFHTEAIHEAVWLGINQRSQTGAVSYGLSAIDIALWDIRGKATGRTVAELLGGHRDWAEVYITFGYPDYDRERLVECAKNLVAEGYRHLKLVVAVDPGGWREDATRIRLVRDAVGDDIGIMIDANYLFSPIEARLLCREIADCRLTWFEEPLWANDPDAMRELRTFTDIPLSAGQMEGNRWRIRDLVERRAVDILQPNCCYVGGYTEAAKAAHLAQAFNLRIANGGGWPVLNMHTMAGLMNGWLVEFHLGMWQVGERIFKNAPRPDPDTNRIQIPKAPGLGLEPNHDSLRDHLVSE